MVMMIIVEENVASNDIRTSLARAVVITSYSLNGVYIDVTRILQWIAHTC